MTREEVGNKKIKEKVTIFLLRIMISAIVCLIILILCSSSEKCKNFIIKNVYENTWDFSYLNNMVNKLLNINDTQKVVSVDNNLFENSEKYLNGYSVKTGDNGLVYALNSGVVVYAKDKEDYGKTIIIQQVDGINIWYGNLKDINVSLYDYVSVNTYIGSSNDTTYYVFEKDGKYLKYSDAYD